MSRNRNRSRKKVLYLWRSLLLGSLLLYLHHYLRHDDFAALHSSLLMNGACLSGCLSAVGGKKVESRSKISYSCLCLPSFQPSLLANGASMSEHLRRRIEKRKQSFILMAALLLPSHHRTHRRW